MLWQFVAVNGVSMAATLASFDPASLLRFPLRFGRYLVLRMLLGLLTPSTIVGCLALLAAAIGIGLAKRRSRCPRFIVLAIYARMNIFLSRMIAVWMERWLATRRSREIFGVLMALFVVGIQFLNFQRASSQAHAVRSSWLLHFLPASAPICISCRPASPPTPSFSRPSFLGLAQFAALLASTALFAAVFAIRLRKQFLGEYLSEGAVRSAPARSVFRAKTLPQPPAVMTAPAQTARPVFPPAIAACLRKEWFTFAATARN